MPQDASALTERTVVRDSFWEGMVDIDLMNEAIKDYLQNGPYPGSQ